MKCTIRKTEQGIVAVSNKQIKDVRPYKGRTILEKGCIINILPNYLTDLSECELILASTFGAGMELYVEYLGWGGLDKMEINKMEINSFIKVWDNDKNKYIDFDTQYEYRIESDKLIITL